MKLLREIGLFSASTLAAATLAGCASPAGIQATATPVEAVSVVGSESWAHWPDTAWWQQYHDPVLDQLEAQALAQNLSLQMAQSRLARAQAIEGAAGTASLPQLGLGVDMTRQRYSENGLYPPPLAGSVNTNSQALLNASVELDLWGRNSAALTAAINQVQAAQAEAQATRVIVSASVARTYFNLARLVTQREVALATLQQREQTLKLVRQRVNAGVDTNVELRQAEVPLPVTRGEVAQYDEQIALTRNALAALLGSGPQATRDLAPTLGQAPMPMLPTSVPADLLARRADVAAAKARVRAAFGDIDVAKAQFYPNINLTAFAGFASLGVSHWFDSGSQTYGAGPAIHLPIFDAGRLRANLKVKAADADAAVQGYNQSIVDAARDVADQLASLQSLAVQTREQQDAQVAAEAAYALALRRYQAGLSTYLTVLTAENGVLAQRRAATDLKGRALDLSVSLNRALGGGYTEPTAASN